MTNIGGYLDDLPELVRDSRLAAIFGSDGVRRYTIHPRSASHRTQGREEKWFHKNLLGEGGQGTVDLEVKSTGQLRAVKKFKISGNEKQSELHKRELIAIFKFSQARYSELFVRLYGWFTSESHIHVAMEYLKLGDLQNYLSDPTRCPNRRLLERDVQAIASQVLDGLVEMHKEGFSHRDLKPANILIKNQPPDPWWVKLADFGISKRGGEVTELTAIRGTLNFMPPELLGFGGNTKATYSFAIDIWCLGETLFRSLSGQRTFGSMNDIVQYCGFGKPFPASPLTNIQASDNAIRFISSLMAVDPAQRLTAKDAINHPWIQADNLIRYPGVSENTSDAKPVGQVEANNTTEASAMWPTDMSFPVGSHSVANITKMLNNLSHEPSSEFSSPATEKETEGTTASFSAIKVQGSTRMKQQSKQQPAKENPTYLKARAEFDFERTDTNDVDLFEGELITNITKVDKDWWEGTNSRGVTGLFPQNHVKVIKEYEGRLGKNGSRHSKPATSPSEDHQNLSARLHKARDKRPIATALYDYEADEDNEISFSEGQTIVKVEFIDEGWWLGEVNGEQGLFPANYVQLA